MLRYILRIEGMMCGMCEAHICDTIRRAVPGAKKVSASKSKREASFLADEPVDAESLKAAINATGYTCSEVFSEAYEKRRWFGR